MHLIVQAGAHLRRAIRQLVNVVATFWPFATASCCTVGVVGRVQYLRNAREEARHHAVEIRAVVRVVQDAEQAFELLIGLRTDAGADLRAEAATDLGIEKLVDLLLNPGDLDAGAEEQAAVVLSRAGL